MSAAILTIGDELLRGDINNSNCTWLCSEITSVGVSVGECSVVPDDIAVIADTLERLSQTHQVIVCTGGLGPTTDDLTSSAAARALGVELQRDAHSLSRIEERFAAAGRPCSDSNRKQADFPAGATILDNDWGTAPGFAIGLNAARVFFFPGVPGEMKPMFQRDVPDLLTRGAQQRVACVKLRSFGAAESAVGDMLTGLETEFDVVIGYRAHFPEIEVRAVATRSSLGHAEHAARLAADAIRERLGDLVYGEGERALPEVVGDQLRAGGLTLALAESCTGGLVAEMITRHPASDYFRGGVVCYDNSVKERLLGVQAQTLLERGAVSEAVVRQMAEGIRRATGADVGLSLSGIAGPSGGSVEKPVGLVHYAVSTPEATVARSAVFRGDRNRVQLRAAYAGLDLIRSLLPACG